MKTTPYYLALMVVLIGIGITWVGAASPEESPLAHLVFYVH